MKRLILNLFLFVYVATTYSEATTKCYVCGKGADEPFKMSSFSNHDYDDVNGNASTHQKYNFSSSCDIFDKSLSPENFIYECPNMYVGCITQISGNDIMRTCDILKINDCKTANGVKYCYCATDLCNGKIIEPILPMQRELHKKFIQNWDDEDSVESSGMSESSLLHINEDDERGDETHDRRNLNDDFHTENINHIDLSDPLWTTLATETTNDNHNYQLTTAESSSTSNLTATKSRSSPILLADFNFNLLLLVFYLILN